MNKIVDHLRLAVEYSQFGLNEDTVTTPGKMALI